MTDAPLTIGMLLYPGLTQLDLTGPFEVFSRLPGADVHLLWKDRQPVTSDTGLTITPHTAFADCPTLDVICVPGGPGQVDVMDDEEVLSFLREKGEEARYVTSVCTGALILGAAGLLKGYKATAHWMWTDLLAAYGAIYTPGRVVRDRNRFTGGGVTAGIDFALTIAAELCDDHTAQMIQLGIEYNPDPPFKAGSPDTAPEALVTAMRERAISIFNIRKDQADKADV